MDKKKLIEVIETELDEVAGMMKESDSYDARSSLHALENIYEDLAKMNYNEKELDLFRRCIDSLDKFVSDAEQEENDAYDDHFRENKEPICEDGCPDLEEAFVLDDEGGPMRKPQQQQEAQPVEEEIMEIFGFGKDKPVVDCEELRNQYARIMRSSAGGPQSDQLHKLRKQIKKNCPDLMGKGIHPLKRRGE